MTDLSDLALFIKIYSKLVLFLFSWEGEVEGEVHFSVAPSTPMIFSLTFQLLTDCCLLCL